MRSLSTFYGKILKRCFMKRILFNLFILFCLASLAGCSEQVKEVDGEKIVVRKTLEQLTTETR